MPRFTVTVQATLDQNRSGPHFQLQLEAASYIDALLRAAAPLEQALNESGLAIAPVAATSIAPAKAAKPTPS